jgi:hypothetical protein
MFSVFGREKARSVHLARPSGISNLISIFQASGLQVHIANQVGHQTCGPLLLGKGTAVVAFREFGSERGTVATTVIL